MSNEQNLEPKKSRTPWIIVAIVITLLCCACIVAVGVYAATRDIAMIDNVPQSMITEKEYVSLARKYMGLYEPNYVKFGKNVNMLNTNPDLIISDEKWKSETIAYLKAAKDARTILDTVDIDNVPQKFYDLHSEMLKMANETDLLYENFNDGVINQDPAKLEATIENVKNITLFSEALIKELKSY